MRFFAQIGSRERSLALTTVKAHLSVYGRADIMMTPIKGGRMRTDLGVRLLAHKEPARAEDEHRCETHGWFSISLEWCNKEYLYDVERRRVDELVGRPDHANHLAREVG